MTTRLDADLLIPGDGAPLTNGAVVFEGPTITFTGPAHDAPEAEERFSVPVAMPGMWDCHAHLLGLVEGVVNLEALITQVPHVGAVRAARHLGDSLMAGFTSIREVGGYGALLSAAVEEGTIEGSTVYGAGAVLSQTGGHGDFHNISPEEADALSVRHFGAPGIADGPDDCRRVVRRQLRLGARIIKVCASGGVMSFIDHPIHQQFSVEELSAIVDEAARADRAVAAHCHGKPGIMAAIEAGVLSIEHGSYLDEESADAMVETGTILVPTRWIVNHLTQVGHEKLPEYVAHKIDVVADRHREAVETAIGAGVRIACGTDVWGAGMWGRHGEELKLLVDLGMSPAEAIVSATATGPASLGAQAPQSGKLEVGYDADIIAVTANPLEDISLLGSPDQITHVWKAGLLHKRPA